MIGRIKNIIKQIVLPPQPYVNVSVAQINYGGILKNKAIVITGGGRGLGYEIAKKCISEGAEVVISGRNEKVLQEAAEQLGDRCQYIVFDVKNVDRTDEFIENCSQLFGREIDCLVSNAGQSLHEGHYKNVNIEGFDSTFDINLRGAYFLAKSFLERKTSEEHKTEGNLIFITSETGDQCYDIPYGLTKAALNSLTGALSRREYKNGIRVNAIAPGVTVSDMTKDYAVGNDGNLYRKCASDRTFIPEEVAEVACFLLSDASKCISGEVIHCNAGNHLSVWWE